MGDQVAREVIAAVKLVGRAQDLNYCAVKVFVDLGKWNLHGAVSRPDPDRVVHRHIAGVTERGVSSAQRTPGGAWRLVFVFRPRESKDVIHEANYSGVVLAVGQCAHPLRHARPGPSNEEGLGTVGEPRLRPAGLQPIIAVEELSQTGGVAPPRGQHKNAGDLPDPGRAGHCLGVEPLFLIAPLCPLQLVGDVDQYQGSRQIGTASPQRLIAGHHMIELGTVQRRRRLPEPSGRSVG